MFFLTQTVWKQTMKNVRLFYNPTAGAGSLDEVSLRQSITDEGYTCTSASIKEENAISLKGNPDLFVLAGGDGTIRKAALRLLEEDMPIAVLPMGTANNISRTLGISENLKESIQSWRTARIQSFDVGVIQNPTGRANFLESFGFGLFPALMKEMKISGAEDIEQPDEKLRAALMLLVELTQRVDAIACTLTVDGMDCSGRFLLLEVMNTKSIGPNLVIAPNADPGDGELDVIFIQENQREKMKIYLENKLRGIEDPPIFHTMRAKNISVFWNDVHHHVDDKDAYMDIPMEIHIDLMVGKLKFLKP